MIVLCDIYVRHLRYARQRFSNEALKNCYRSNELLVYCYLNLLVCFCFCETTVSLYQSEPEQNQQNVYGNGQKANICQYKMKESRKWNI